MNKPQVWTGLIIEAKDTLSPFTDGVQVSLLSRTLKVVPVNELVRSLERLGGVLCRLGFLTAQRPIPVGT